MMLIAALCSSVMVTVTLRPLIDADAPVMYTKQSRRLWQLTAGDVVCMSGALYPPLTYSATYILDVSTDPTFLLNVRWSWPASGVRRSRRGVPVMEGPSASRNGIVAAWTRWTCAWPHWRLSQEYTPPSMWTVPVEYVETGWRGSMCSRSDLPPPSSTKIIFFAPDQVKLRLL